MNATSMLVTFLQTAVCLTAALAMCAIARKSSSVRLLVSQIAIVVCALFMIAGSWLKVTYSPMVAVTVPESSPIVTPKSSEVATAIAQATSPEKSEISSHVTSSPPMAAATQPESATVEAQSRPITLGAVVSILYSFGLAVSLIPMVLGAFWIRKTRRGSRVVASGQTIDVLARVAARHRVKVPTLYASDSISIPFVTGLLRKQIFVPTDWIEGQCDIACSAVIEHEVAHIVSRDIEWKFVCRLVCSLVWFQPLMWVLLRVMSNASEELCDQSVLASGVANTAYANTLLDIREKAKKSNVPGLVIGAVSRESNLSKRMKLILATDAKRIKRASRLALWFAVCCFAFAAATSTFVFGQSTNLNQPGDEGISLADYHNQPVIGAKAWLMVGFGNANMPELRPLRVRGNAAIVTNESMANARAATLVVQTAEGQIDFKRIGPNSEKISQFNLAKPSTVKGRLGLPAGQSYARTLKVAAITKGSGSHLEMLPLFMFKELNQGATLSQDGNFELKGISAGSKVRIQLNDDRIAQDWNAMELEVDSTGKSAFFRHQANLGGTIEGRVSRDGKPMAGISIAAQGQGRSGWGQTVTDANGFYRITRLDPDKYNIAALLDKSQRQEFTIAAQEGVVTKYGDVKRGINLSVIRGGTISGVVVDTKGKVVPNAQVAIFGQAFPGSSAMVGVEVSDGDGRFIARVPPGDNKVYYYGSDASSQPTLVHVSPDKDTKVTIQRSDAKKQHEPKLLDLSRLNRDGRVPESHSIPNGSQAMLMYVCQGKGDNVKIWFPDGTPVQGEEFLQDLATTDFVNSQHSDDAVFARVVVSNIPQAVVAYQMDSGFVSQMSYSGPTPREVSRTDFLVQMRPHSDTVASFKLGVPFGAFHPIGPYTVTYDRAAAKPNKTFRVTKRQDGMLLVELVLRKDYAGKYLRVKAKDSKGMEITLVGSGSVFRNPGSEFATSSFIFRGPKKIARLEVAYQDIQWVKFDDIHLKPNR